MVSSAIMLFLDTDRVCDHEKIRTAVSDIASKGFDAICMEFRNCIFDEFDQLGMQAMAVVAEECTKSGLKLIKTLPWPGMNKAALRPHDRQQWLCEHRAMAVDGAFRVTLRTEHTADNCKTSPQFRDVPRIFHVIRKDGAIVCTEDVTDQTTLQVNAEIDLELCGSCRRDGELLIFARYSTDGLDFASEDTITFADELFEQVKALPICGIALDEYGSGSRRSLLYNAGRCFLKDFHATYGYDLMDKAYLLNNESIAECAGKVRHDYYRLTVDHTHRMQTHIKRRFTEALGPDIFIGFHHTWWGEGNSGDLWGGNIDYFRLAEGLSGGFVDAQYDAERTMVSMTMLAESLAKYTDSGLAYNMCWDRNPTLEKLDYYHRLLATRNVRWIGHAYGRSGGFGPGYPEHHTWPAVSRCIRIEEAFQKFVGGAVSRPKVAVLYLWESLACHNGDQMHYHRLGLKAMLEKLLFANIEVDVIPSTDCDLDRYQVLFAPWPLMMPEQMWQAVKAFAARGGRVIFSGPPARCTTAGRDISGEFAQLVGARPLGQQAYAGDYEYVAWDLWFTDKKIEMECTPLQPENGTVLIGSDGGALAVRNGSAEYYPFELPLTHWFDIVLESLQEYRELKLPKGILSKVSHGDGRIVITLAARWGGRINCEFGFEGNTICIAKGTIAGLALQEGKVMDALGNDEMELRINGIPFAFTQIR